ncbi:hypothetical protein PO124_07870 [Bacillus licheniformis]|nr:hypothetical protein [Bacillus licheniformis]
MLKQLRYIAYREGDLCRYRKLYASGQTFSKGKAFHQLQRWIVDGTLEPGEKSRMSIWPKRSASAAHRSEKRFSSLNPKGLWK